MRAAVVLAAAVAACGALGAGPASAKGVVVGRSIAVMPDTSSLELTGYAGKGVLTVGLERNGIQIAAGRTDGAANAVLNGGTSACWTDFTPEILAGDTIRVSGPAGVNDAMTVADITTHMPEKLNATTIVVHGTAKDAGGNQLPVASLEVRIVAASPFANGRKTLRAIGLAGAVTDGTIAYDGATTNFTATFALSSGDVTNALSAVEARGIYADPTATEVTISQGIHAPGPMPPGCSQPLRRDGVTASSRSAVNADDRDLVLSGVASDATGVTVSLDDGNPATDAISVPATLAGSGASQSFTATIGAGDVRRLDDGMLTASATYALAGGGTTTGATLSILKDTVAPPAPVATPGAGTYATAQSVALEDADGTAAIHWTAGGTTPSATSARYGAPILVTASQRLQAVAIDAAGNTSPVAAFPFVIAPPALPAPSTTATPVVVAAATSTPAAPFVVSALTAPARISRARLRTRGLALSMRLPKGTETVRIAVYRAGADGRRTGRALASLVRLPTSTAGTYRLRLRDRALRTLRPGRYVVEVRPGRGGATLGVARTVRVTITR